MSPPRPTLGQRMFHAVAQHILDTSPELRVLAEATGFVVPSAPVREPAKPKSKLSVPKLIQSVPKQKPKPRPTLKEDVIDLERGPDGVWEERK